MWPIEMLNLMFSTFWQPSVSDSDHIPHFIEEIQTFLKSFGTQ